MKHVSKSRAMILCRATAAMPRVPICNGTHMPAILSPTMIAVRDRSFGTILEPPSIIVVSALWWATASRWACCWCPGSHLSRNTFSVCLVTLSRPPDWLGQLTEVLFAKDGKYNLTRAKFEDVFSRWCSSLLEHLTWLGAAAFRGFTEPTDVPNEPTSVRVTGFGGRWRSVHLHTCLNMICCAASPVSRHASLTQDTATSRVAHGASTQDLRGSHSCRVVHSTCTRDVQVSCFCRLQCHHVEQVHALPTCGVHKKRRRTRLVKVLHQRHWHIKLPLW